MVSVNMEDGTCSSYVKNPKRLTLAFWLTAWDKYSLAAEALEQLKYTVCVLHKAKIMDLATEAVEGDKGPLVAVIYDELLRRASSDLVVITL